MSTQQQFKKVSPLSHVPHDIFPVVSSSGRHKQNNSDESVERKEWSTYLTIPGIMQPILITLPSMKLPVCNKCKGQFKTRKYCRLEPRKHMSLPWSTVYLCLTFDDSCYDVNSDSGMEIRNNNIKRRLKTNQSFTAKIAEFDSSSTSRNKWRPFVIRENSETSPLKKKKKKESEASSASFALSNTKNNSNVDGNSCIDSSSAEDLTDTLPMCMDCKKKRYTGTFCRGKTSPHMYLPWSTVYYDIFCNKKKEEENPKDDDDDEEEKKHDSKSSSQIVINSAEENVCLSSSTRVKRSDSLNSTLKKDTTTAADNLQIPNIFDNLTGPCSKTLFVHMSAKECKFEWVDYDNEKASRMQFDNESESKSFKLQKNSSPKKTCETNEDEEEDHKKYDVMPSLPRHNNSHGGHQHYPHYPHHDPYMYSSHHLHHHVFHHPVVHPSYHTRRDNGYNSYYPTCRHSPYNPPQHPQHPQHPHHGGFIDSATTPVPHAPPQLYHQGNSNNNSNNNNKRSFHHIMDSGSPHNNYSSPYYNNPGSPPNSSRYSPRNYSPIRIRQQPQQQHYHVGAPMDIPMAPPTQRINHPTRVVGSSSTPSTRQYHEKRNHIMECRRRDIDGSTIHNIHDGCDEPHQFQPQLQQTQAVTQSQLKIEEERIYHQQQQERNKNKRPRLSSDYSLNNDFDGAPVVVEEGKSKDNKNESSSKSQWGENPFMTVYQYE